jgi:zeaxanthin glucosyltransferase
MYGGVPPFTSSYVPKANSRVIVPLLWYRIFLKQWIGAMVRRTRGYPDPNVLRTVLTKLSRQTGYPLETVNFRSLHRLGADVGVPELIFAPKALDFPQNRLPENILYAGPSVDMLRRHVGFPWNRLDGKPIVYCTMGSSAYNCPWLRPLYQTVIEAVARRPEFQLVLVAGDSFTAEDFHDVPGNAILVRSSPQVEVLKKSVVMIAHGGLGTIKEAILCGVPMILFPFFADQPGNSARIVYHGLGLMGNIKHLTPETMLGLLDRVTQDQGMLENVRRMGTLLEKELEQGIGIDIIERFASRAPVNAPKSVMG